jgi:uncharacterized membrane protein
MSTIQRSNRPTTLWAITAVVALGLVIVAFVSEARPLLIVLPVGFALLHGAQRYGWRAMGVFVVAGVVISNLLENLSIQTGFPFGHYHYTGSGKIFLVPWSIGLAYVGIGYLAWVVATVLVGDVRRNSPWLTTIGTPVIAAFAMTAWDLASDPGPRPSAKPGSGRTAAASSVCPWSTSWAGPSPSMCSRRCSPLPAQPRPAGHRRTGPGHRQ